MRPQTYALSLVAAAFGVIAARGFEGLRTREVAASVGVNIATLHYYFPRKEDLIRGVVAHAMARFRSTLGGAGSAEVQLRTHFVGLRRLARDEPALFAVMAELAIRGLSGGRLPPVQARPVPRHPAVERDIAVVVTDATPAARVEAVIGGNAGPLLAGVRLFDIYRGAPLGPGEKSLAYRLTFQHAERTLTEGEVDAARSRLPSESGRIRKRGAAPSTGGGAGPP